MKQKRAFTLIELLVVIAIIAVLMGILMPALRKARDAGKMISCQSNQRTLTTAWYMYAMDNDDKLCGSWNYNASGWGDPWDWVWAPWQVNGNSTKIYELNVLDTITDTEVLTTELPFTFVGRYAYSVQLQADSLTGATDATVLLQQSNSADGDYWVDVDTITINGVLTNEVSEATTAWPGARMRLKITGGDTQSTEVSSWVILRKLN
jgi:prepilin-type N-terminal cleavage/methylation domain-containing protein